MITPPTRAAAFLAIFSALAADDARGQGLSVDVSAGRAVYDAVSATVATTSVMGTVRYDADSGLWVYGTMAGPLRNDDPTWGAFGVGGRFLPSNSTQRRATAGIELGAHGYVFRDALVDRSGNGGTIEAVPFVNLATGSGSIEVRGGWRGHSLSYAGGVERRSAVEAGARATYGAGLRFQGDTRWVRTSEGTYPYVGGMLYGGTSVEAWVVVGKWLSADLDAVVWGGGTSVPLGRRATLWVSAQRETPDPLVWNAARWTWSVGITHRLGRSTPVVPTAPRSDGGATVIRLPASEAMGQQVSIAGDFNNWQPAPMQREGGDWVIRLTLAAGVYHYAFRSDGGEWFVPSSVAGRRDDGMGGQVAVLVVS